MKETGIVHAVKDREILVRLKRHAACLGCRACSLGSSGEMIIKAIATDEVRPVRDVKDVTRRSEISNGVKVGDMVTIEVDSISIIKAIAFVYLLPAIAFLIGIFAGLKISSISGIYKHKEIFSILIGVVLLSASLFLARRYGIKRSSTYQARITGKVPSFRQGATEGSP